MTGEAQDLEDGDLEGGDLEGGGLDGQARAWVVRLASGDMTATELAALKAWLADSERHWQAFAEARALWQDLEALEPAFAAAEAIRPGAVACTASNRLRPLSYRMPQRLITMSAPSSRSSATSCKASSLLAGSI